MIKFLKSKAILYIFLVLIILLNNFETGYAASIDAFEGSISNSEIEKGSDVVFSASVYNFKNQPMFIYSFNVSFVEILGQSSVREANSYNLSKIYEGDRRLIYENETFSDVVTYKIDFPPGKYNISIFFGISNSTATVASKRDNIYALSNYIVEIIGITQSIKIAKIIATVLITITVLLVILYIYNKLKKK